VAKVDASLEVEGCINEVECFIGDFDACLNLSFVAKADERIGVGGFKNELVLINGGWDAYIN
jgi:hypothetical protein